MVLIYNVDFTTVYYSRHGINIIVLAVKPAEGGLHCYGAPSTAALQWRSDDCDSTTEP